MTDIGDGAFQRVGFWRRALAWIVDSLVVILILQICGLLLFSPTDGRVQSSAALYSAFSCRTLKGPPAGLIVPTELRANYGSDCTRSMFGYPHSRMVTIGRITKSGSVTSNVSFSFFLNSQGELIRSFDFAFLLIPLLYGMRVWMERNGRRSLGRRLLRIRLIGQTERVIDGKTLLKRYGLLLAPSVPTLLLTIIAPFLPSFWSLNLFGDLGSTVFQGVLALPALVMAILVTRDVARKRDPYFDRMAGTLVIRD